MRNKIVAGNWKMNKIFPEGINLIQAIIDNSTSLKEAKLVISPPYLLLNQAVKLTQGTNIGIAAQNCSEHEKGAFTGEISAPMLSSLQLEYVIVGHSERRAYFGETDESINLKIKQCLSNGLMPIVCCGEVLQERENNEHFGVVAKQIKGMFEGISAEEFKSIIIAYEPVWAIGTGKTATPDQAQEIHQFIRETVRNSYGSEIADNLSILYGGSCKPSNAKELFSNPDVDGGLIGGASLKAEDFIAIANSF